MLGWNQNVRNVPVSSRMMNEYSAISPSRNVQWSGKIFLKAVRKPLAPRNRSSSQPPTPSSARSVAICLSSLPEARPDRLMEITLRYQVSVGVGGDRQLRQRPGGRPEDHPGPSWRVERGLVARG